MISKKNAIIVGIVAVISLSSIGAGMHVQNKNQKLLELSAETSGIENEASHLLDKGGSFFVGDDVNSFLTKETTSKEIETYKKEVETYLAKVEGEKGFLTAANKLKKDNAITKEINGNKNKIEKLLTSILTQSEIKSGVNQLFGSVYVEEIKGNKKVVIKDDLTKEQVKKTKELVAESALTGNPKKVYEDGIAIADSQLEQIAKAKTALEKIYKNKKVAQSLTREKYERVVTEVKKIKNKKVKLSLEKALAEVEKVLVASETQTLNQEEQYVEDGLETENETTDETYYEPSVGDEGQTNNWNNGGNPSYNQGNTIPNNPGTGNNNNNNNNNNWNTTPAPVEEIPSNPGEEQLPEVTPPEEGNGQAGDGGETVEEGNNSGQNEVEESQTVQSQWHSIGE